MTIETGELASPIGTIVVAARGGRLCALGFAEAWAPLAARLRARFGDDAIAPGRDPAGALGALAAYLGGALDALDRLPLDAGGTPFQTRVWTALRAVPAGSTVSYGELARRIGAPTAARAVGAANGANPISLVVPCHRAVGRDGRLTGYAWGLERKRWLLAHERGGTLPLASPGALRLAR